MLLEDKHKYTISCTSQYKCAVTSYEGSVHGVVKHSRQFARELGFTNPAHKIKITRRTDDMYAVFSYQKISAKNVDRMIPRKGTFDHCLKIARDKV